MSENNSIPNQTPSSISVPVILPQEIAENAELISFADLTIECEEDSQNAGMKLLQVMDRWKATEAFRKALVKPINDHVDSINAFFSTKTGPLKKTEMAIKSKIAAFIDSQQKKKNEELRIKLAQDKKDAEAKAVQATKDFINGDETALETRDRFVAIADKIDPVNAVAKQTTTLSGYGRIAPRKVWKFKVVDPMIVPRDFLIINEKMINGVAKSYGEAGKPLPGIEFYQETSVSGTRF